MHQSSDVPSATSPSYPPPPAPPPRVNSASARLNNARTFSIDDSSPSLAGFGGAGPADEPGVGRRGGGGGGGKRSMGRRRCLSRILSKGVDGGLVSEGWKEVVRSRESVLHRFQARESEGRDRKVDNPDSHRTSTGIHKLLHYPSALISASTHLSQSTNHNRNPPKYSFNPSLPPSSSLTAR